jgi:hypothetical protein
VLLATVSVFLCDFIACGKMRRPLGLFDVSKGCEKAAIVELIDPVQGLSFDFIG